MFQIGSILRYNPIGSTDESYTAVILEEGVWESKGIILSKLFPTVEAWLETLPGSPEPSMLQVSSTLAEEKKRIEDERIDNVKKGKKKQNKIKWNVPSLRNIPRSLPWARHIYSMIQECDPELLKRADICDAYNHLVQTLLDHNESIHSIIPYKRERYLNGITLYNKKLFHKNSLNSYIGILPHTTHTQYEKALDEIYTAYQPLYVFLEQTVVPFMNKKYKQQCDECDLKEYRRYRDQYVTKMINLTRKYEQESALIRGQMERYQSYIDEIQKRQ